jgi:hypothetical protein
VDESAIATSHCTVAEFAFKGFKAAFGGADVRESAVVLACPPGWSRLLRAA